MPDIYQIHITRKGNQTATSISDAPLKDVYAMIYGAVELVAQNTNQSVENVLGVLAELDQYAKKQQIIKGDVLQ